MPLKAEDLPPEIWLNIFSYFEGRDLVQSFSCLNTFFNSLLRSSYLKLHIRIRLHESNRKLPDFPWSHINLANIYSLVVGRRKANCLLQFLRWHATSLKNLSFLSVFIRKSCDFYNIELLISALVQLTSLKQIRIKYVAQLQPMQDYVVKLLENIFQAKFSIEKYSLVINFVHENIIKQTWSINPMIKSLNIAEISLNSIVSILFYTPEIRSLEFILKNSSRPIEPYLLVLNHLQKIHLHICCASFMNLILIKTLSPNLQIFLLDGLFSNHDENYFDENMWNQLLGNLKYFQVNLKFTPQCKSLNMMAKNYIIKLQDKSWFSHIQTVNELTVFIKFKSTVIM